LLYTEGGQTENKSKRKMIQLLIKTRLIISEIGSQRNKLGMMLFARGLSSIGDVGQRITVQDPPLKKHKTLSEIII
jgi:hypothetical protein